MSRTGLYAWGGPGTIRLLHTKYHTPRIDAASFMQLYEPDFLRAARATLGVTDMWVTYSWGFADATEQDDWRYITARLPQFAQHGIQAHAYVQGLNVVTADFVDQDIFCRDAHGRLQPYSRGRSLTCPNNPAAAQLITDRVRRACGEAFDGVYVDNVLFGLPPFFVRRDFTSFFGCACTYCQDHFRDQFGYPLPHNSKTGTDTIGDFLAFRVQSVQRLLADLADICRAAGKQFGFNLYDPLFFTPELHCGYRLSDVVPLLDYVMIENHTFDRASAQINNVHLRPLIESSSRPVFIVSYRNGIGYDAAYSQADVDAIWSEAAALGYHPCLKATEFITEGIWHALDIDRLRPPTVTAIPQASSRVKTRTPGRSSALARQIVRLFSARYPQIATMLFENRWLSYVLFRSHFYARAMRTPQRINLLPLESRQAR